MCIAPSTQITARSLGSHDPLTYSRICPLTCSNRSRLSHDFYQIMAGKSDMTLHGLRQLAEWSIEHSCLEDDRKAEVRSDWEAMWESFCRWIVKEYAQVEEPKEGNALKR